MCEGDVDHGFRRCVVEFVVFAEPARPVQPCERTFHDPALWQYLERVQLIAFDHLHIRGVPRIVFEEVDIGIGVPEDAGQNALPVLAEIGDVLIRVLIRPQVFGDADGREEWVCIAERAGRRH